MRAHVDRTLLALLWTLLGFQLRGAAGDFVHEGGHYDLTAQSNCPFPPSALATGRCNGVAELPQVNISAQLVHLFGVDQKLFTFSATVELDLVWLDDGRLLAATNNASAASNCTHPCSAGLLAEHSCCDHVWRPTLRMDNALKLGTEVEYFDTIPDQRQGSTGTVFPVYSKVRFTGIFDQRFSFNAFPFDRHALGIRLLCSDCRLQKLHSGDFGQPVMTRAGWLLGMGAAQAAATQATLSAQWDPDQRTGGLAQFVTGADFPESSGWHVDTLDLFTGTFTTTGDATFPARANHTRAASADVKGLHSGAVFVVRVHRVTRAYYTIQCFLPPIIIVVIGFFAFTFRDFLERLKVIIGLLFPLYTFQFSLSAVLPGTFTLLSPNDLVFASEVVMLMLVFIAAISYAILERENLMAWLRHMRKGRENWDRHKLHMWKGPGTASGPQDIETATSSLDQKRLVSSQSLLDSHACACLEDSKKRQEEEIYKAKHKLQIEALVARSRARWRGCRHFGMWWNTLAMDDVAGYRERVVLMFELVALSMLMLIYAVAILAIIFTNDYMGRDRNSI